jgi:hypothetical protein
MYRHVIYNHFRPNNWLITSYEAVLSGLAKERLEKFTDTELDFSFPKAELNRSTGQYTLNRECAFIYEELRRLEHQYA